MSRAFCGDDEEDGDDEEASDTPSDAADPKRERRLALSKGVGRRGWIVECSAIDVGEWRRSRAAVSTAA